MNDVKYLKTNYTKREILDSLLRLAFSCKEPLQTEDETVLCAVYRKHPQDDSSISNVRKYIASLQLDDISELLDDIRTILHDMECVEISGDGPSTLRLAVFYQGVSGLLTTIRVDVKAGVFRQVCLDKEYTSEIKHWIDSNKDEVCIPRSVAESLEVKGITYAGDTVKCRVEYLVDVVQKLSKNDCRWAQCKALPVAVTGLTIWMLYQRYKAEAISRDTFIWKCADLIGNRLAEDMVMAILLSIPGLNVITGTAIITKLILSTDSILGNR